LADDSGLCVDALSGRPGVWSSSYGGIEGNHKRNCTKLLTDLLDVPEGERQAYFICILAFEDESGQESIYEGRVNGVIATSMTGAAGFGYDPLFYVPEKGCTMAELSESEKNKISHRGLAMAKFMNVQR
jgi:XTP/dITP diphosphohydrolase